MENDIAGGGNHISPEKIDSILKAQVYIEQGLERVDRQSASNKQEKAIALFSKL